MVNDVGGVSDYAGSSFPNVEVDDAWTKGTGNEEMVNERSVATGTDVSGASGMVCEGEEESAVPGPFV